MHDERQAAKVQLTNKFLNPVTDGAVLPILHLNGYKISSPTLFSRITSEEVEDFFKG